MKNVVAHASFSTATNGNLIAAGPITKQPSTLPYRIVLVEFPNEFAVYSEIFDCDMNDIQEAAFLPSVAAPAPSSLNSGNYFNKSEFTKATMRFAERVAHHAENYYDSLYREEPTKANT